MTTTWKAVSAFSALGVAALLIFDAVIFSHLPIIWRTLNSPASQSPVRIVGGSITMRAKQWDKASNPGYWVTADNIASANGFDITIEKVKAEKRGEPTSLAGVMVPWEIDAYAANPDGSDPDPSQTGSGVYGLALCTNPDPKTGCQAPIASQLPTVTLGGISNGKGTAPSLYTKYDALKGFGEEGKRFYNNSGHCDISGGDLCEHIFRIVLKIGGASPATYTYKCPDGECRVDIDPAQ